MSLDELIKKSESLSRTAVKQELVNSLVLPLAVIVLISFVIIRIFAYLFGWFNKNKEDYEFDKQKYILASFVFGALACGGYILYERKLKINRE
jgi:uncharacterized membrane protein